jgi:hypothetical protein
MSQGGMLTPIPWEQELLNLVNINSVTALAAPQSLVLVQISEKYYFYRGIANRSVLDTSNLVFGSDVTKIVEATGLESLLDSTVKRIINLGEANPVVLPRSGQMAQPQELKNLFQNLSLDQIRHLEEDISAIVPQLQASYLPTVQCRVAPWDIVFLMFRNTSKIIVFAVSGNSWNVQRRMLTVKLGIGAYESKGSG